MCIIFFICIFFFFFNKKLSSDAMDVEGVFERMCWCYLMYAVVVRCILCHAMVSVNRRCGVFGGSFLFFAHFLIYLMVECIVFLYNFISLFFFFFMKSPRVCWLVAGN